MLKYLLLLSLVFTPSSLIAKNKSKVTNYSELLPIYVTMYNAVKSQTDDTPTITASNEKIHVGVVALSRDLEKKYGFKFGDKIHIKELGVFVFKDRMNKRFKRRIDIYSPSITEAKKFGKRKMHLIIPKKKVK